MAGPQAWLDGPEEGTNGRTENLPILQDFVPIGAAAHKPEER